MPYVESGARPFTSRAILGQTQRPGLADWLLKKGVVKTEAGARAFTRGFILGNFILAAVIFYFFVLVAPAPMNGLTIIHHEAASVDHLIEQAGWPDALVYIRTTTLVAVGDILGALYALMLPTVGIVAAIVLMVIGYHRYRQNR
jgi:hypothetical protein